MKSLHIVVMLIVLSSITILFSGCPAAGHSIPPRWFYVCKFVNPEYAQYVTSNSGDFLRCDSTYNRCYTPISVNQYYYYNSKFPQYKDGGLMIWDFTDFSRFEADKVYYPLHGGYFLQYPYLVQSFHVLYDLKWTALETFDVDLTQYDTLALGEENILEKPYFLVEPSQKVKTFEQLVDYLNQCIDKGNLSEQDRWCIEYGRNY